MKYLTILALGFMLLSKQAFALDFLGPHMVDLKKGQSNFGIEFVYGESDIDAEGGELFPAYFPGLIFYDAKIKNVEMNKIYLRLSIVPTDDCELFLRFGGAKADVDKNSNVNNLGYIFGESDNSFSVGCGTKITINKSDNASWGFIAQLSGVDITDFDKFSGIILGTPITVSPEAEVLEAQFAIGPTVKLADNAAIYGGAMFHILDGEAKFKGKVGKASVTFGTTDLEQNSFGGYVGMGLQIAENSNLNFEYQATGDSYAFGAGMVFKFGKVSPDIPKTKRLEDERGTVPPKQSTLQQKEVPLSEPIDKNKTLIGYRVQTDKYGRRTRIPVYEEDEKKK